MSGQKEEEEEKKEKETKKSRFFSKFLSPYTTVKKEEEEKTPSAPKEEKKKKKGFWNVSSFFKKNKEEGVKEKGGTAMVIYSVVMSVVKFLSIVWFIGALVVWFFVFETGYTPYFNMNLINPTGLVIGLAYQLTTEHTLTKADFKQKLDQNNFFWSSALIFVSGTSLVALSLTLDQFLKHSETDAELLALWDGTYAVSEYSSNVEVTVSSPLARMFYDSIYGFYIWPGVFANALLLIYGGFRFFTLSKKESKFCSEDFFRHELYGIWPFLSTLTGTFGSVLIYAMMIVGFIWQSEGMVPLNYFRDPHIASAFSFAIGMRMIEPGKDTELLELEARGYNSIDWLLVFSIMLFSWFYSFIVLITDHVFTGSIRIDGAGTGFYCLDYNSDVLKNAFGQSNITFEGGKYADVSLFFTVPEGAEVTTALQEQFRNNSVTQCVFDLLIFILLTVQVFCWVMAKIKFEKKKPEFREAAKNIQDQSAILSEKLTNV